MGKVALKNREKDAKSYKVTRKNQPINSKIKIKYLTQNFNPIT